MNDLKYWFNGLPFVGIESASAATGTLKFWFNGLPAEALFPAEQGQATILVECDGRWL